MSDTFKSEMTLTESGFLFDHSTGLTYTLNPTGRFIFQHLLDKAEPGDILRLLGEEFEVSEESARKDMEDFFRQMKELGLIG